MSLVTVVSQALGGSKPQGQQSQPSGTVYVPRTEEELRSAFKKVLGYNG